MTITRQEAVELVAKASAQSDVNFLGILLTDEVWANFLKKDPERSAGDFRRGHAVITALESAGLLHWPEQEK